MNKPTMQDIADRLSVSRITVWKAMNDRPGVSEELQQQILQVAREMGYYNKNVKYSEPESPAETQRTVSAVVSRPESSLFWMQIIHQLAKELSLHDVNLMYTYLPTFYKSGYHLPSSLTGGEVSGIIVLNVYDESLLKMLTELPIPKVFLDTVPELGPEELDGDLIMIEGRTLVRRITERLFDIGCNRIGFVGDIKYALTNTHRYAGYLDAFMARGIPCDTSLCMTGRLGLKTHYEELSQFLDGLSELPDAFVCASDYIAHFIDRYCTEHDIPAEKRPLLTGFDNNTEYANVAGQITTVDVDTKAIGARLANQILYNIDHSHTCREVSYLSSEILYRGRLAEPGC